MLSAPAFADESDTDSTNTPTEDTHTTRVTRGQSMTKDQLASIASLSSARDQQGNSVPINAKIYTIGSFTRTTITIVPPNGGTDDVITLDLLKK